MRIASGILCFFASFAFCAPAPDYLAPDIRATVEALKADLRRVPTNDLNVGNRARVLWQWINAYSLTGRYVPVNATQAVSTTLAYPTARTRARYDILDRYIREFTLLDEQPGAIGALQADLGPFEAAGFVTIEQTYTVGTKAIETSGGFLVARHFMPNYGVYQTSDAAADNHVTIRSSNRRVKFSHGTHPMSGMHGGFRGANDALVFRIASGQLNEGDTVTITYGDRSEGSRGFRMSDVSSDRMPLPLYLDFDGSGHFFSLPIQPIVVVGSAVFGVHAFAPSIVAVDEPFDVSVRAEDRFYNRATGALPQWQVAIDDMPIATIPAKTQAITLIPDITISGPGVYRITVTSADGAITGSSNPILVEADPTRRIYWGDTHGHSGFAEGVGTPDRFMTWARDDARLDFVTHSEHDIWMDDFEWNVLRNNVKRYHADGEFVAFVGYEWTVRNYQGGHHNVLFRTADGRKRVPAQTHGTLSKLYQGLRNQHDPADVVVIPHAHQAGDYRLNDPLLEPLIEIMSQHGTFEWFGRMYLRQGHQVGFTAASDNHLSQPGYTAPKGGSLSQKGGLGALRATEKTGDALFDAMKDLAAYATTGDRIILDVSLNGLDMGQRAPFAEKRNITGRVVGTAPIDTITVVRNDEPIWEQSYSAPADDSKRPKSGTYLVTFQSDSEPVNRGDNPRGWRMWRGSLTIQGAEVVSAEVTDYRNTNLQSVELASDTTVAFSTHTRGATSSLRLELEEIKRSAEILIELDEAREFGGGPPIFRAHQAIPDNTLTFELAELSDFSGTQSLDEGDYIDRVTVRRITDTGPSDIRFDVDDTSHRQGDYYYVRVKQTNDAYAWSSPIWVGGYPKK